MFRINLHLRNDVRQIYIQVTKKFSERKQAHVGMGPSKTSRTKWERHHNTFTPSLHLVPFCQLCFVFVSCVHSTVVEGSWEGIAGCVVHVAVHGECVCCGWMQCSCS